MKFLIMLFGIAAINAIGELSEKSRKIILIIKFNLCFIQLMKKLPN